MSNSVTGCNKFIIFGVVDGGVVEGLSKQQKKNQNDIIDFFQNLSFSGRTPLLKLDYYDFEGACIGVLTIEDTPYKPFFLNREYPITGKQRVHAGAVYTRIGCRNTPRNGTAKDYDVERMWKERFGIVEKNKIIFDNEAYANIHYMVPVLFTSFYSLTFTFIYQDTSEIFTTVIDIEDLIGNNKIKFFSGDETIDFHHKEICLISKYSDFLYCHLNKSYSSRNIVLKRMTGVPK